MKKAELSSVSRPEILDSIKDDKSLRLLNSIEKGEESENLLVLLNISRKEYYLRMSKFVKTGIVTRRQGKYVLTSFGTVIYELQLILVEAIDMKLKTFDSFISDSSPIPSEWNKISTTKDAKLLEILATDRDLTTR